MRHEQLSFKLAWLLRGVEHERFFHVELILRLFEDMEVERSC